MTRHNFILALLITVFIGFSVSPAFAQNKNGKHSKIINLPKATPKELFVDITVKGSGTQKCEAGLTCTWKIDRHYSGTIILEDFGKLPLMPFDITKLSEMTMANKISQITAATIKKPNNTSAFNYRWTTIPSPSDLYFDVRVSINDEYKISWNYKNPVTKTNEARTLTETWKADNKTGKAAKTCEVVLDKETQAFKLMCVLNSDAKMIVSKDKSYEELNPLPLERDVFPIPTIEGYLHSQVIIPIISKSLPDEKKASFEKTFTALKAKYPLLGGISETQESTITVTYKFK